MTKKHWTEIGKEKFKLHPSRLNIPKEFNLSDKEIKQIEFMLSNCVEHHYGVYKCADECHKGRGKCRRILKKLKKEIKSK